MNAHIPQPRWRMRGGDLSSAAEITPAVYGELRPIASRHLGNERKGQTLQPTALVHEAYLKLSGGRENTFADGVHFLPVASRVMRQVLVDYARSRSIQKRFGAWMPESVSTSGREVKDSNGLDKVEVMRVNNTLEASRARGRGAFAAH